MSQSATKQLSSAERALTITQLADELRQTLEQMGDLRDNFDQAMEAYSTQVEFLITKALALEEARVEQIRDERITDELIAGLIEIEKGMSKYGGNHLMRAVVIDEHGMPYAFNDKLELINPWFKSKLNMAVKLAAATTGLVYSPAARLLLFVDEGGTYESVNMLRMLDEYVLKNYGEGNIGGGGSGVLKF